MIKEERGEGLRGPHSQPSAISVPDFVDQII